MFSSFPFLWSRLLIQRCLSQHYNNEWKWLSILGMHIIFLVSVPSFSNGALPFSRLLLLLVFNLQDAFISNQKWGTLVLKGVSCLWVSKAPLGLALSAEEEESKFNMHQFFYQKTHRNKRHANLQRGAPWEDAFRNVSDKTGKRSES